VQRLSNTPESRVQQAVQGLRRLARVGQVTPGAVLAVPELMHLPLEIGLDEPEAEAAIGVARSLLRAMDSTSEPATVRLLFGVERDMASRPLSERRERAAMMASVTPGSFRVRREARLIDELARVLLIELTAGGTKRPAGGAHLEIEHGSVRTTIPIPIARLPVVIGRDASCDIQLRGDIRVSRQHARLSLVNGRWVIEDLGSTNGTELEAGRLLGRSCLSDGDVMTIGQTRLTFRIDQDDPTTTVAGG
jgi:FHA domain